MRARPQVCEALLFALALHTGVSYGIKWLALSKTPAALALNQTQHCKQLEGLVSAQVQLCRSNLELMGTLVLAAREAMKACRRAFADMRWNCSSIELAPNYLLDLERGTRESAFVYALAAAAISHALRASLEVKCKCHGVSGSCSVRTCWKGLRELRDVAADLKARYLSATKVVHRPMGTRKHLVPKDLDIRPVQDAELVYLQSSPDFCVKNEKVGSHGDAGQAVQQDVERQRQLRPHVLRARLQPVHGARGGALPLPLPLVLLRHLPPLRARRAALRVQVRARGGAGPPTPHTRPPHRPPHRPRGGPCSATCASEGAGRGGPHTRPPRRPCSATCASEGAGRGGPHTRPPHRPPRRRAVQRYVCK
ncbi:LOW QUALITY PROTEIN: protein Wnt-11 [Perognathus longimembris pacificus]|uniref:LOW QUALITY PROTEIN: protein Wnt-11 n=1 Tax=Perognathus longimembris pacificus TaxID=214514 RepID=UPI002019EDCC|nr:LOW QUALITY PROTEIN: protein Wnt-11 [Perognathus longimembris pacificus]